MRVALSTISRFHTFDLARQLIRHDALTKIFSGYPWWKLSGEGVPRQLVDTWPWIMAPRMALARCGLVRGAFHASIDEVAQTRFARHVARNLPECDIFHCLSRYALEPGLAAQRRGSRFILDVGSSHMLNQNRIVGGEAEALGLKVEMPHPNGVQRELEEYEAADLITVPSEYALQSFIAEGVPREKLAKVIYGVDLTRFSPRTIDDDGVFRVVFVGAVGMRKGVHHLVRGFRRAAIPNSELVLIGMPSQELPALLAGQDLNGVIQTGHVPQPNLPEWLSRSTVMVLPTLDEGFGLVMLQAMACGCPVIASDHTGSLDCIDDGKNGFIVRAGDPDAIADKLVWLAEHPEEARAMRQAALAQAAKASNVTRYGDDMITAYRALLADRAPAKQGIEP